jgi:hypothetical protein
MGGGGRVCMHQSMRLVRQSAQQRESGCGTVPRDEGLNAGHFVLSFPGYTKTRHLFYCWLVDLRARVLSRS